MTPNISIIGSGNWGTAIGKLIATNIQKSKILMWTLEEQVNNQNLTTIINTTHENVKYLPNVILPDNLVAEPDLLKCIEFADILVFVVPHQFVKSVVTQIKGKIKKGAFGISLIKGIMFENELKLVSDYLEEELKIDVSILMGANIANEVAHENLSEGTLVCKNKDQLQHFMDIFDCQTYKINCVDDKCGVEICGTLKNIVSIGYGIGVSLNYGNNTTVAIFRKGLLEMVKFGQMFFKNVKIKTFFESCGVADLLVSCLSGRNYKCGLQLAEGKSKEEIEEGMKGQKLQGTLSAKDVYEFLKFKNKTDEFPLFTKVYRICFENEACENILQVIGKEKV